MAKKNAWNIIFIALDVNDEYKDENKDNYSKEEITNLNAIKYGWEKFEKDYTSLEENFANSINLTALSFFNNSNVGTAKVYQNTFKKELYKILFFDCYASVCYSDFLKTLIREDDEINIQKYLFIFLAHSFGGGFTYHFVKDNPKNAPSFLSVTDLQKSFSHAFGKKNIDVMLALNCTLQSIDVNYIFRNNLKMFIGSQQPIRINSISYKHLFTDLFQLNNFPDEIIFTKYISDLYQNTINLATTVDSVLNSTFNLSITYPQKSVLVLKNLNLLADKIFQKKNKNSPSSDQELLPIKYASVLCEDPSPSDTINILDAIQFFLNLKKIYLSQNDLPLTLIIENIINSIQQLVLTQTVSPLLTGYPTPLSRFYIPFGVGIFIPKVKSTTTFVIKDMLKKVYIFKNIQFSWFELLEDKYDISKHNPVTILK